jgi:hypothetical protein
LDSKNERPPRIWDRSSFRIFWLRTLCDLGGLPAQTGHTHGLLGIHVGFWGDCAKTTAVVNASATDFCANSPFFAASVAPGIGWPWQGLAPTWPRFQAAKIIYKFPEKGGCAVGNMV